MQCEFFLIRYVPDAVKNEFVNIGVMLREAGGRAGAAPLLRLTRDWARVRCVDPEADTAMLEALELELRARLAEGAEVQLAAGQEKSAGRWPVGAVREGKPVLEVIEDSFSNLLQVTEAKACLAESLPAELDNLMRVYVESQKREAVRRQSGRARIQTAMRNGFEREGVWALMRKRIAAETYTRAGDPLRIDCGYRPNGVIRMFHAVSLENETDLAKVLAFSMPALREGVARVEGARLELTAVVEPLAQVVGKGEGSGTSEVTEAYRFAVETMEAQAIRVMTTTDMPRMAETARGELLRT
jgi:hypothetical protein